jgi:hypothetical protein
MRFTLIAASLGAVILLLVFGFLLFKSPKENIVEIPSVVSEVPTEAPLRHDEVVASPNPDVSQEDMLNELPLGNDINMEFPTLEE